MIFSIITAKLIARLLRVFHFGATTLPGRIALGLKYNVLNRLSRGVKIICVTGTNGKTTTCALLEYAMQKQGLSYFINKSGANMISGVATSFIENCNVFGRCKREYAILECDENSLPEISRYIDAEIVAVTNIFRDQLDRYGEMDSALNSIIKGIENMPDSLLILNADCPLTYSISSRCGNRFLTFGINADYSLGAVSESRFCPICRGALKYNTAVYAQLGDYYCSRCSYKRKTPDVFIGSIFENPDCTSSFVINGCELARTSLGGIYNIYNYCCAAAVLKALCIYSHGIFGEFSGAFGRMERFYFGNNKILLLLVKNPVGFSNCINYVLKLKGEYNLVFALNDNEADGCDVSWIWDTDFSGLRGKSEKVLTIGRRAYDMALRLKYDGISVFYAIDGEDYNRLIKELKSDKKDCVIFANYTSMMNMRKRFVDAFGGKEFWE